LKRDLSLEPEVVQTGNRQWWNEHPMNYDWRSELRVEKYSREWFDAIDARQVHGHRLFATDRQLYDRLMPIDQLRGKRVLEIGCGMGLHTETLIRAGADVTAVDLTPAAIEATTRRIALKGLQARVMEADAETLPFADSSFDFVWSWGVIHHSSRTTRIVRQIARVVAPDGETRVMVYNREGTWARAYFMRQHLLRGKFLRQTFDETLWSCTDGFCARYYVREQFEDLFRGFFDEVSTEICGQEEDALPLPRVLRQALVHFVPDQYMRQAQARRGSFIFLKARQPMAPLTVRGASA